MTLAEQATIVERIRANEAAAKSRVGAERRVPRAETSLPRCAARYSWLCRCTLAEAADALGCSRRAARTAWAKMYPGIPARAGWR